ncbi:MAG: alpha/beta hydrolase [Desulfobacteraceae bacterium]|nr:MAG: alpha/beta hydrolase [Desulfobacteraceae bacterium]
MPFLKIMNRSIYYEEHGEGETMILLHHGFGCTEMWSEIYPPLVEAGYRVILYDRRGFGRSERGDDFMEFYTSDRVRPDSVQELEEFNDALSIGRCHLIGQCEGGVVAIDYAAKEPERVASIAISSTQCYSEVTMEELNREKFYKAFHELDPNLQKKYKEWHGEEIAEAAFNQFRTYGGEYGREFFDLRPVLPHVSCPVLILYPDRSFLFSVEQAVAFYRGLPLGELMVLPNCVHNTYEQEPEEYVRAVLNFMKRQKNPRKRPVRLTCAA